jgi:hypothetical protein
MVLETELIAADVRYRLQNQNCLLGYFRADSITRQHCDA